MLAGFCAGGYGGKIAVSEQISGGNPGAANTGNI